MPPRAGNNDAGGESVAVFKFDVVVCAPEVTVEVVNFAAPPLRDAVFRPPCPL